VARNTKIWSLSQTSQPCLYLPLWQSEAGFAVMHVKSKSPLGSMHRMVERELERLDPSLPVASGRTLEQQLETALFPQRIALVMLGVFSISGIYMAAMGLFGVIAHAAQSRAKEIAIRMALGATAQDVCRLVAQQAAGLINLSRQLGGSFGIAVLLNYVTKHTEYHRADLVSNVIAGNPLTDQRIQGLTHAFIARGMSAIDAQRAALKALDAQVMQQASMLSFNDSWLFILLVFTLVSPAILLLKRPGSAHGPTVDAH